MKKVLLAVDGSKFANDAAALVAQLPLREQLEIIVLTVLDDLAVVHGYATLKSMQELIEHERQDADAAFQNIKAMFAGTNAQLTGMVVTGHRGETIVEVAKQHQVQWVVVGARGHSMLSRLILGSTSDYVATHAHCSVLVVRPTDYEPANRELRVTIGYEDSGPAQAALEEFLEFPWGDQPEVNLVNVVSYMTGLLNEVVPDPEPLCIAAREVVERAIEPLRAAVPSATGHVIASDHAGDGLVRFAEQHHSDLIVVGETHRTSLGRFLLGSFSRYVLRHAPCSVWICRNRTIQGFDKTV